MTRGYIVITDGKKIVTAVYSPSDSYMGRLGMELIEHLKSGSIESYVAKDKKCFPEYSRRADNIRPEWYRRTKDSDPEDKVAEYGYEFNRKRNELKAYHNGRLLCTITAENADHWIYVARHEEALSRAYLYDEKKLCVDDDRHKLYRTVKGLPIQAMEAAIKETAEKVYFNLEDRHIQDVWHSESHPAYVKHLYIINNDEPVACINFYASAERGYKGKWAASVQLPYIRVPLDTPKTCRSEKAAVDVIRELVRAQGLKMAGFAKASFLLIKYDALAEQEAVKPRPIEELDKVFAVLQDAFYAELARLAKESPWFTAYGYFTVDKICEEFYNKCCRYRRWITESRKEKSVC